MTTHKKVTVWLESRGGFGTDPEYYRVMRIQNTLKPYVGQELSEAEVRALIKHPLITVNIRSKS